MHLLAGRDWAMEVRALVVLAALALAACGADAPAPTSVPAPPPLAGVVRASPPAALGPRPQDPRAGVDMLLAQVCRLVAYVVVNEPLLALAAGESAKAAPPYPECEKKD